MAQFIRFSIFLICLAFGGSATAQTENGLTIATVSRAPFSMPSEDGGHSGFSIDLFTEIATGLERDVEFERYDSFRSMLDAVEAGAVDGAIANISITSEREAVIDFSQPIFRSGLRIMIPYTDDTASLLAAIFTRQLALVVLGALGALFLCGMLMWVFERGKQPYFDRPLKNALFPSFWWALNVVVNGGFEERMPQSRFGRVFAVIMIVASLFVVSIFVAQITAATTVQALQGAVDDLNDLDGRSIGTIDGSTAAQFLQKRSFGHQTYGDLDTLVTAFEAGDIEAVVFDAPVLAYYVENDGNGVGKLTGPLYRPENYGIALPSDSDLADDINQVLLRLHEDGTYTTLVKKWFGRNAGS